MKQAILISAFTVLNLLRIETVHSQVAAPSLPNIIIILADDGRYDEYRPTGAPDWFVAPSIERIANQGANFTRAYVPTAMCAPSRASIYTGLYAHQHGADNNNTPYYDSLITIQQILEDQGYYTGFIGKYGQGFNAPNEFDYWINLESENYLNVNYNVNGVTTFIPGHTTDVLATFVNAFLDSTLVHSDQPFALFFFPLAPHPPATPRVEDKHAYDGQPIPFPTNFYAYDSLYPQFYYEGTSNWVKDSSETEDFIRERFCCLRGLDDNISDIFNFLDLYHEEDNTFMAYTSDNGYIYGQHLMRAKVFPIEEAIHVPLFVKYTPWFAPNTVVSNDLAEIIDLPATLLDLIGVEDTFGFEGISLHSLAAPDTLRHYVRYEYAGDDDGPGGFNVPALRGVRSFNYLYSKANCDCFTEEFYDFSADPQQNQNEILNPDYQPLINQYRSILDSLMLAVDDTADLQMRNCEMIGSFEIEDGYDEDCDGLIDDSIPLHWYRDLDGDLFGDPDELIYDIGPIPGYVLNNEDCNDSDPAINPAMIDYCDHLDNDCDGIYDEVVFIPNITPSGSATVCTGDTLMISVDYVPPGFSVKWYKNGVFNGVTTPTLGVTESGDYKAKVRAPANCVTESPEANVTKVPNPHPKVKNYSGTVNLAVVTPIKLSTKNLAGYSFQWYWYGFPLWGATENQLFVYTAGAYKVKTIDPNGCVGYSHDYWIWNIFKGDEGQYIPDADFSLYPNPATTEFNISFKSGISFEAAATITIHNMLGQQVYQQDVSVSDGNADEMIDLPATITPGVYIVQLAVGQQKWQQELVVK